MSTNEKSRGESFVNRIPTKIWLETPSKNPFVAKSHYCYGFEHSEIVENLTFAQSIHLLTVGELPSARELALLNRLLNLPMAIGARHEAARAAMNAGVSRTKAQHILPIALQVLSGEVEGSLEVAQCHDFISRNYRKKAAEVFLHSQNKQQNASIGLAPGFGQKFGSIDVYIDELAELFTDFCVCEQFKWAMEFANCCKQLDSSWLLTGLFSAVCIEMGYTKKQTIGLFQQACAPLLLALGIEKSNQALTAMPFIKDEDYTLE